MSAAAHVAIGPEHDAAEHQASSIARAIVREPAPVLALPACPACAAAATPCPSCSASGVVRRSAAPLAAGRGAAKAPADWTTSTPATPLAARERSYFEVRLGADLSGVRLHTDISAGAATRAAGARAMTLGQHIAFAPTAFDPASAGGRELLAHELVHTLQDDAGTLRRDPDPAMTPAAPPQADPDADDPALGERLENEVTAASDGAAQDDDLLLRASSTRLVLLLRRTHPPFHDSHQVDVFVDQSIDAAETELGTLLALGAWGDFALATNPKGFPLTWAGRIRDALSLHVDLATIIGENLQQMQFVADLALALPASILTSGLPLTAAEIMAIEQFRLHLADARREDYVGEFARAVARSAQLQFFSTFVFGWETMVEAIANSVADGSYVPSYHDYEDFITNKQAILRGLPERARERIAMTDEELQAIQNDAMGLQDIALGAGLFAGLVGLFGIMGAWQNGSGQFDASLRDADGQVGAMDSGDRIIKALRWAWANGYFSAALSAQVDQLIASGPRIVAELAAILIAQMIPGVNVAVDVYLIVKGAYDLISLVGELASAFSITMQQPSVVPLQRSSVHLSQTLTAGGMALAILIGTAGVARAAAGIRRRAGALRASEIEAGRVISEEEAMRRAARELSEEEQAVLRPAAEAGEWEMGLNRETAEYLRENPGVRRTYMEMPPAIRRLLTHCASLCIIPNITRGQISRVVRVVERLGEDSMGRLKIYFHVRRGTLDLAITELERVRTPAQMDALLDRALIRAANLPTDPIMADGAATALRSSPGEALGGMALPQAGSDWLAGAGGRAGLLPGQVAETLRGRTFANFGEFQSAFWEAVAADSELSAGFNQSNRTLMARGEAPFAPNAMQYGGASAGRYTLHHVRPIEHGGGVFDMDNLLVVSPRLHSATIHAPTRPMPALPPLQP